MLNIPKLNRSLIMAAMAVTLTACGGGGSEEPTTLVCTAPKVLNDAGNACITPPVEESNTAPTFSSAASFSVEEGSSNGTVVYTAVAADAENHSISFSLVDTKSAFTIDSGTGVVTVSDSDALIADESTDYSIVITATDNGSPAESTELTIAVTVTKAEAVVAEPEKKPNENEGAIYYFRADNDYAGFTLHAWNNETCNGYADFADPGSTSPTGTEWSAGLEPTGTDDNYGVYWSFDTKADATCANFIIHKGDVKDPKTDQKLTLSGDRWAFVVSDVGIYTDPAEIPDEAPFVIKDASAHWVSENTIVWNGTSDNVKLVWSIDGDLDDNFAMTNSLSLTKTTLSDSLKQLVPHLSTWQAYTFDATDAQLKQLVKSQLVLTSLDADDEAEAATYVQFAKAFDDIYTSGSDDADEQRLGVFYNASGNIELDVWAPSAQSLKVEIFDANKTSVAIHDMTENTATGIWSFETDNGMAYDRLYYRFLIDVYHPLTKKVESLWSTDPYSVNTSTNGRYSQFVNMTDADLYPAGWASRVVPTVDHVEQGVLLEAHIRDFSIRDENTTAQNRGKYKAFTETGSDAMTYLSELADAGVTHFHMLPANDIATIEEDESKRIDLTNTVAELCAKKNSSPVCGVESDGATLMSVLQSYDPATNDAKNLVESMRGLDGFNWGYDPHHFNVVEGSYASDPEDVVRIKEFREMVLALHETGLRVVLDVVYNHTSSSGTYDNSVFDKLVPGYYHRYNEVTGIIERSTCCENTATEHRMMDKFVVDSLVHWATHYGMDGFRFDVMGHLPAQLLIDGRAAVAQVDADTYFYGEGWNLGEVSNDRLFTQATQYNLADSEIGTFNDRPRDTIRNQALTKATADLNGVDYIRLGLAGTLQNYELEDYTGNVKKGTNFGQKSYALDPADIINYVSKHDNETLYDVLQYSFATDVTAANRARIHLVNAAIPLMSQGLPFFQLGVDKLRSKSMDRNTYDAGDWFNYVDYTNQSNNWNVGLPLNRDDRYNAAQSSNANAAVSMTDIQLTSKVFKELLSIRASSPLFSLKTEQDVINRVGFHNTGVNQTAGLIVMSIDDGTGVTDIDVNLDALVVVINGTGAELSHTVKTASGFALHANHTVDGVGSANFVEVTNEGTFTVPAYTVAVFVNAQGSSQGPGLSTDPDKVASPFSDTVMGIEGLVADSFTAFEYDQRGNYTGAVTLQPGDYEFNIGDATLAIENLAFADVSVAAGSETIIAGSTDNFAISITQAASYNLVLNVEGATPELSITLGNLLVACSLPDSTDTGPFDIAGDGSLYVKGDHSGWNAEEAYKLKYKGNNIYQAVADFEGDMQFKLASSDGNWATQLWAQDSSGNILMNSLDVGTSYDVAYDNAGENNNAASLAAGKYSFKLTLSEDNPSQGKNVGTLIIEQCTE